MRQDLKRSKVLRGIEALEKGHEIDTNIHQNSQSSKLTLKSFNLKWILRGKEAESSNWAPRTSWIISKSFLLPKVKKKEKKTHKNVFAVISYQTHSFILGKGTNYKCVPKMYFLSERLLQIRYFVTFCTNTKIL